MVDNTVKFGSYPDHATKKSHMQDATLEFSLALGREFTKHVGELFGVTVHRTGLWFDGNADEATYHLGTLRVRDPKTNRKRIVARRFRVTQESHGSNILSWPGFGLLSMSHIEWHPGNRAFVPLPSVDKQVQQRQMDRGADGEFGELAPVLAPILETKVVAPSHRNGLVELDEGCMMSFGPVSIQHCMELRDFLHAREIETSFETKVG